MRQLNLRFSLILIGSLVMLAGGLFLLHRAQSGRIARAMRRQADRAEQQGRTDQQVKYLARYLEFVPDDNEVRAQLGHILASPTVAVSGRARERALFVLEQVLLREPDRHDCRRLLVRVAFQLGRLDVAREHLDVLAKNLPDDSEVLRLLGQWYEVHNDENKRDLGKAAGYYAQAIEKSPREIDGYVRLAYLLQRRPELVKQLEKMSNEWAWNALNRVGLNPDQVMALMVDRNAESFQAHLARWHYRKQLPGFKEKASLEEAGQDVARALKLAPDDAGVITAAAELAQLQGDIAEARKQLNRGLDRYPQDGSLYQALARVELQDRSRKDSENWESAIHCLRKGIKAVSPGPMLNDLRWTLANVLMDDGKLAEAEDEIDQLRKVRFSPGGADFLTARLAIKKGQWVEAMRVLERARPLLESELELSRQADLLLVQCYERLDEPAGRRMPVYQRLLKSDPNTATARQALAASLFAMGRLEEALEQYRAIAQLPDTPPNAWTQVARLLLLRNLQRVQRDWKEVEDALNRADPSAVDTVVLRAQVLLEQGKPDESRRMLEAARDREPKRVEWWAALAAFAQRQKQFDRSRELLLDAEKQCGDSVQMRLAWARYLSAREDLRGKASLLVGLDEDLDQFSPEDQATLILGLVEAHCRLGEFKDAEQLWARLAQQPQRANDLRVQQVWFDLALKAGSEDALARVLETIQRLEEGQGPLWHYGEALRLIRLARQGKKEVLDQARAHLDAAANRRSSWPAVFLARAQVEDLKGNPEQAIASYRRALELGERSPQAIRELVQLLHRRRRLDEADQEIRRLGTHLDHSPELQRLAADISLQSHDPVRAVSLALKAVGADSSDYRDYLWRGQVLAATSAPGSKEHNQAGQDLERAVKLGGDVPETWVAWVRFLAANQRLKDAEAAMQEAKTKLPPDQAPLALAQCYELLDRFEEARKHYNDALNAQPREVVVRRSAAGFYLRAGRLGEAEPLLRSILDCKIEAADIDIAWARRSLAQAIANYADYRRFPEALALLGLRLEGESKLIEEKKPSESELAEELKSRARVLVTTNRRPLRRHAIDCLEALAPRLLLTPDDQFLLAQLYEADGKWPKAREQFRNLTAGASAHPLSLAHAARSYLRQREHDEARRCIDRLEHLEKVQQVERGHYGSVELRAQWLEATGKGTEAVALLRAYAERQGAPPEALLLLAGCLARQNDVEGALRICEAAWTKCPPEAVGGTCVAALRAGRSDDGQWSRVETMLRSAIEKNLGSPMLLVLLADVHDLQGRYNLVEKCYRQILSHDASNIVALNNLAWLLAREPASAGEALSLINRAIERMGPRAELLDTRALVHLALGRPDQAIVDLERSNAEAPSGQRFFRLARAHQTARNLDAAAAAFRKAKDSGLQAEQLHPVERVAFLKMLDEMR